MPLIFAVDNDTHQSAQLASLLRSHVDADLVQSATVLDGIGVLQGRIPDLVLTSSLLSLRDESALANHMRELGTRAAHVHTMTIPVLATAPKALKKRHSGVLGALRREKSSEVDVAGCQPEAFATEVRIYLERAVDQRGGACHSMAPEPSTVRLDPVVAGPAADEDLPVRDSWQDEAAASIETTDVRTRAPESAVIAEPDAPLDAPAPGDLYLDQPEVIAQEALLAQPPAVVADAFTPPETRVPVVDMSTFDDLDSLAAQLAAPSGAAATVKPAATDPFEVTVPALASNTWFDRMNAAVRVETPAKPVPPPAPEPVFSWIDNQTVPSLSDVLSRVRASSTDTCEPPLRGAPAQAPGPVVPAVAVESTGAPEVHPSVTPAEAAEPAPPRISPTARPEILVDLVLSPAAPFLDPDVLAMFGAAAHRAGLDALESLSRTTRTERDTAIPARPVPGPPRVTRESKAERRSRRRGQHPAQDEWGMYDPNQCGPAALFDEDTWNEVDTEEKVPARRPRAS